MKITDQELEGFLRNFVDQNRLIRLNTHAILFARECSRMMSHYVILKIFGYDWLIENAYHAFKLNVNPANFAKVTYDELVKKPTTFIYMTDRLKVLAESLVMLRSSEGFGTFINETKKRDDFEAIFAEILSARYLHIAGMPLKFVKPKQNGKGSNFDLQSQLRNGEPVACEVKARLNPKINLKTYLDTLQGIVNRQTASLTNKIIFIKVPYQWTLQPEFETVVQSGPAHFMDHVRGVKSISLFYELGDLETNASIDVFTLAHRVTLNMGLNLENEQKLPWETIEATLRCTFENNPISQYLNLHFEDTSPHLYSFNPILLRILG